MGDNQIVAKVGQAAGASRHSGSAFAAAGTSAARPGAGRIATSASYPGIETGAGTGTSAGQAAETGAESEAQKSYAQTATASGTDSAAIQDAARRSEPCPTRPAAGAGSAVPCRTCRSGIPAGAIRARGSGSGSGKNRGLHLRGICRHQPDACLSIHVQALWRTRYGGAAGICKSRRHGRTSGDTQVQRLSVARRIGENYRADLALPASHHRWQTDRRLVSDSYSV
jgi:hypothetical protein